MNAVLLTRKYFIIHYTYSNAILEMHDTVNPWSGLTSSVWREYFIHCFFNNFTQNFGLIRQLQHSKMLADNDHSMHSYIFNSTYVIKVPQDAKGAYNLGPPRFLEILSL